MNSSHNTTHPSSNLPLTKIKILVNPKIAQFYSLPSDLLHNIDMWHLVLVLCNKLNPVLAQLTQQNNVLRASKCYKLKYILFWLLHALLHNPICVYIHMPWTSHIWPWLRMVKSSQNQTWVLLTSYDHLRLFHIKPLNFIRTTPTYMPTSFQIRLLTNNVPTYVLFSKRISFYPHIPGILNSFTVSLSHLTAHAQTVSLPKHPVIRTHALAHFFTIGLMQISASIFTHVLRCRTFLENYLYYINNHHIITPRKPLLHNFSSFDSPYSVLSFYKYLDK